MVAFYLDEDVSEDLVPFLQQHGHFVTTTASENRKRASDPRQLLYAVARGWVFITYNRDHYELLHDAWLMWSNDWGMQREHNGILIPQPVPKEQLAHIADAIHDLVRDSNMRLINSLYQWSQDKGWRRWT